MKYFSTRLIRGLLVAMTMLLAGCGAVLTKMANNPCYDKGVDCAANGRESGSPTADTSVPLLFEYGENKSPKLIFENLPAFDDLTIDLARRFGFMALLSELVYHRKDNENTSVSTSVGDCHVDVDSQPHLSKSDAGQWFRWRDPALATGVIPCFDAKGLLYDTYAFRSDQGISDAIIVFRGTNERVDWASNINAAFGREPAQYKPIRESLSNLTTELREHEGINIYTAGHSLGGGLAQSAAYFSRNIRAAYTFNTSPITNWTQLRLDKEVDKSYPSIFRIYHGGEALGLFRIFSKALPKRGLDARISASNLHGVNPYRATA